MVGFGGHHRIYRVVIGDKNAFLKYPSPQEGVFCFEEYRRRQSAAGGPCSKINQQQAKGQKIRRLDSVQQQATSNEYEVLK